MLLHLRIPQPSSIYVLQDYYCYPEPSDMYITCNFRPKLRLTVLSLETSRASGEAPHGPQLDSHRSNEYNQSINRPKLTKSSSMLILTIKSSTR